MKKGGNYGEDGMPGRNPYLEARKAGKRKSVARKPGRRKRIDKNGNAESKATPGRRGRGTYGRGTYGSRMERWVKLATILFGVCLLLFLLVSTIREMIRPAVEGETVTLQEAGNLTWLLADTAENFSGELSTETAPDASAVAAIFTQEAAAEGDGMLTFGVWEQIVELFPESGFELPDGYRKKDKVPLEDWYAFFDAARAVYDRSGRIRDMDLTPIGLGNNVTDSEGSVLEDGELVSAQQAYHYQTDRIEGLLFRPLTAVERDGTLYAVRSVDGAESSISNIWIMEVEEEGLRCFWNDYEVRILLPAGRAEELGAVREQVADLAFEEGNLTGIHMRTEKISGKLLKIRDNGAEIEGRGFFPFSENLKIYRLYGTLKRYYTTDLCIGYDFTDFVLEDGQIEAALVVKEESMENVRVLIKTSDFGSAFHDLLELSADCDLSVITGEYGAQQTITVPAGETVRIDRESEWFTGQRIRIEPSVLTGKISLHNVSRSQGTPSYRGSLELEKQADGIVVINEVLLEEYLYAVVPSEMPATYPLEALKAQAVCARTYAYAKMLHAGLPAYGAHVDDSAGFQVYNNTTENAETTKAVKETSGELVCYGDELVEAYYYSTSCGYGTDTGIWLNSVPENFPYLASKAVNVAGVTDAQGDAIDAEVNEADIPSAEVMTAEENFASFIRETRPSDFESGEAWYRWTYQVEQLDSAVLYANIVKRYEASPGAVYVRQEDGSFLNQAPVDPGRITDLYIAERNEGGVAEKLVVEGENAVLMIETEHNIRYVLSNGVSKVIRQDGSEYNTASLLPSAFFVLETGKENGYVIGYSLIGGGFGHGVGLSQNGARNMALRGCDSETILGFFYSGSSVRRSLTKAPEDGA